MPTADASEKRQPTSTSKERRLFQSSSRSQISGHGFSFASTETGESSRSASTRASTLLDIAAATENDAPRENDRTAPLTMNSEAKDIRLNHRSRQSRSSGGFLLSNTAFEAPAASEPTPSHHGGNTNRRSDGTRDHKGKSSKEERKLQKRRSAIGLGIVGSPLASNVTSAAVEGQTDGGSSDLRGRDPTKKDVSKDSQGPPTALDIDSAQIVNLALNLSEHRKLAARRNFSTPIPPLSVAFEEVHAGGSLKYHLQQQRRTSRNASPKPEKVDRNHNASPRLLTSGQRIQNGLRSTNTGYHDGEYQYYFSPSTLARAEKARNAFELMAQYRRVLQYVPPLKPVSMSSVQYTHTPPGTSSDSPGSSRISASRPVSESSTRPLGRPYNPLQYIRNRKLRARERCTLDGESEGFSDVDQVKAWVDQISSESVQPAFGTSDNALIPCFPGVESQDFQQTSLLKNTNLAKYKRPRIDWIFTPEDLFSDLHWLEQGDNKKRIEDRDGRKIFPQQTSLKRPLSGESPEPISELSEQISRHEDSLSDRRIDAELPKFKSARPETTTRGRARQKLHDTIHGHHRRSGSFSEGHWRSRSESELSKSEDESRFRKSGRSRSREPPEPGRAALEKQMGDLLAKEARENEVARANQSIEGLPILQSVESPAPSNAVSNSAKSSVYSSKLRHQTSHNMTGSMEFSSGRPSLEVPYARLSFEGFDSSAPNSPLAKAAKPDGHVPGINLNLSPSPSRASSPTRKPLQRVRSKINKLRDRSRHPTTELENSERRSIDESRTRDANETSDLRESPEFRRRSISPTKRLLPSRTDSSSKSMRGDASMRRKKGEDGSSGLRGLIKGGRGIVRGPVSHVRDFIWKKDNSPGSVDSLALSSSDDEGISSKGPSKIKSHESAAKDMNDPEPVPEINLPPKSYLKDMPSFRSSFDYRDRIRPAPLDKESLTTQEGDHVTRQRRALSISRSPRFDRLKPPRIDVQTASPSSSPEYLPRHADSDVSDIESRRTSYATQGGVYGADARLNSILGLPGHLKSGPPVTALAGTSLQHDTHSHSHSLSERGLEDNHSGLRNRQWSISERAHSTSRGPMTKREIARVRALLLSSAVKAKEIARREEELIDLRDPTQSAFSDVAGSLKWNDSNKLAMIPKYQEHIQAARILSTDMQISSRLWQASANSFSLTTIPDLTSRIHALKDSVTGPEGLAAMCRIIADEADALGRELVGEKTMAVKGLTDAMEMMQRRRRRRFRWIRRGGWVALEWVLVGVMWWVWLIVVLIRTIRGLGGALIRGLRWLFWL